MDAGAVQGLRERDPRRTARDRHPRPGRPGTPPPSDPGPDADPAVIPADPAPRSRLDVIA
ncbi:MAG: hypothetical protein KIT14_24755 [bacterium]|nr:hypothetical protein [bacterium]